MSFRRFFDYSHYFFSFAFRPVLDWFNRIRSKTACPISWQPSLLAPVFYGIRDHALPSPCRVFYPSLDGAVWSAQPLDGCGRYPLILFLHGNCDESEHYKKWYELPGQLARCGYVVVVPELPSTGGGNYPWDDVTDLRRIANLISWLQGMSPYKYMLLPSRTGVVGHSWGALLGARIPAQMTVSAYASVNGGWGEHPNTIAALGSLMMPTLHCWGTGMSDAFAQLNPGHLNALATPNHTVSFRDAEHWDCLPAGRTTCQRWRGTCSLVGQLVGDIVCTFFGKYLPPEQWPQLRAQIPDTLIAPPMNLTFEQEIFAGGHLRSLIRIGDQPGCSVTLAFRNMTGQVGSVTLP